MKNFRVYYCLILLCGFYLFWFGTVAASEPKCKTGIGLPWIKNPLADLDVNYLASQGTCQIYDWGINTKDAEKARAAGIVYYPMLWSCKKGTIDRVKSQLQRFAGVYPGSTFLMFNEPNVPDQANCTPQDGAETYYESTKAILMIDPTAKFACCGEGWTDYAWTDNFYNAYVASYGSDPDPKYRSPIIDYLHVHWYMNYSKYNFTQRFDTNLWKSIYEEWRREFKNVRSWTRDKQVLITEFSVLTNKWYDGASLGYNNERERMAYIYIPNLVPWIAAQPEVKGFFWFSSLYDPYLDIPTPAWVDPSDFAEQSNMCCRSSSDQTCPTTCCNGYLNCKDLTAVGKQYFKYVPTIPIQTPTPTLTPIPIPTTNPNALISALLVSDTNNASDWSIRTNLQTGDIQYGDRTYTFSAIPTAVTGADWIRTANDSKAYTGTTLATFTAKRNVTVYTAHNDSITSKPSWLSGWTDTGENIVNSEPRTFSLYSKNFASGSTVSLGPNGDTGSSLYTIVVKAESIPTPTPTTPVLHFTKGVNKYNSEAPFNNNLFDSCQSVSVKNKKWQTMVNNFLMADFPLSGRWDFYIQCR